MLEMDLDLDSLQLMVWKPGLDLLAVGGREPPERAKPFGQPTLDSE